jgi:hypothetical protein
VIAAASSAAMVTGVYPLVPHLGMMLGKRRARRPIPPRQVRSMATEWAVSVALGAARPLGILGSPLSPGPRAGHGDTSRRPIITVHGYAMNRACFLPLSRRLARAGLGPVYGFEYWTLGSIAHAARRLGEYVE